MNIASLHGGGGTSANMNVNEVLARQLIKIGSDLRLLNSGPVGGLKEIDLPATQAGSSIMPGKVNPVIPEYTMQLSMQATGLHQASATALAHAELDLNIWESLITCNTLDMIGLTCGRGHG